MRLLRRADTRAFALFARHPAACAGRPAIASVSRRGPENALTPSNSKPAIRQRADNKAFEILRGRACMRAGISSENSSSRRSGISSAVCVGRLYAPIGLASQASQQALASARTRPI